MQTAGENTNFQDKLGNIVDVGVNHTQALSQGRNDHQIGDYNVDEHFGTKWGKHSCWEKQTECSTKKINRKLKLLQGLYLYKIK